MESGTIAFEPISGFDMSVRYVEGEVMAPDSALGNHAHAQCEIYVHLGGDVSFMVEDQLYPIQYGNIVITRPYEYHHCIYHSTTKHSHFWILFSGKESERVLDIFFRRQKGSRNLFKLNNEQTGELIDLCHALRQQPKSEVENYFCFFNLLRLLELAEEVGDDRQGAQNEMASVLRTIHRNYASPLSVRSLAKDAHISVSTLERWFSENFDMTPSEYIRKIRLSNAARLLSEQSSVTEAAEQSGFSDVSAMITLFKERYGMTPLKYKKQKQGKK